MSMIQNKPQEQYHWRLKLDLKFKYLTKSIFSFGNSKEVWTYINKRNLFGSFLAILEYGFPLMYGGICVKYILLEVGFPEVLKKHNRYPNILVKFLKSLFERIHLYLSCKCSPWNKLKLNFFIGVFLGFSLFFRVPISMAASLWGI